MNWFKNIFRTKSAKIYLDAADRCFAEVCAGVGNSSAAEIYKLHPDVRDAHWKEIRQEFASIIKDGDDQNITNQLRSKWAEQIEQLTYAHFYTNLPESDRNVFAAYSNSDRATEDTRYYWSIAYHYTYASLVGGIILGGWTGPPGSKEHLEEMKNHYISICRDWISLVLDIARKKQTGIALTDDDKERGRNIDTLKEFCRRTLAGEKLYDNE